MIGRELTACERHVDCTLVETACSACCMTGAIASDRKREFDSAFDDACSDYQGGECDCAPPDVVARCKNGQCVTIARTEIEDCFSPAQNASSATAPDAVGCHCAMADERVCTDAGVLECVATGTEEGPVWQTVDGGSCSPRR